MIESIRIDDRLIHGQVALVWSKELGTTHIVVANDHAASNDVTKMTLQMALPSGIKLLIKKVSDAIIVFNDFRAKTIPMFVLTNNVHDALRIVKECPGMVGSVNVANVGRFDDTPEKTQLNPSILLNEKELDDLKELAKINIDTYCQVVPTNSKIPIKQLLSNRQ